MTHHHRLQAIFGVAILGLFLVISGCAPTQSQSFRSSFLPSLATSAPEPNLVSSTPTIAQHFLAKEVPNPLPQVQGPSRPTETERRLMEAQDRFNAGKKAYDQGRVEDARREFDRAIDILLTTPEAASDRSRIDRRLEQIVDAVYRFDVNGLGSGEDWDKVVYDKSPLDGMLEMTFPVDPRLKPKVIEELRATVSQLPLEQNDAVLSYIHFFSSERGRKILVSGLRRAGRYKALIQQILSEEGVPQELIYLAQAESGFQPRAMSYRQAVGMWQFVKWRGQEYGLDQTGGYDERLDPEKATRAAARHLRDLYNQFGDWYLAMAAYNCGPGCVDKAVQRTGYADFWKLRDLGAIPKETSNYVPLILAMTIINKNAKDYGLDDVDPEPALEYETVKLEAPTSLALLADAAERSVTEIRDLNPSLLKSVAPVGYELRLPKGTTTSVATAFESIPANRRATWRMHRVSAGETLATIAKRYRTAASAIAEANPEAIDGPSAGEVLIIPASYNEDQKPAVKKSHSKSKKGRAVVASHSSKRGTVRTASSSRSRGHVTSAALQRRASTSRVKATGLRRVAAR